MTTNNGIQERELHLRRQNKLKGETECLVCETGAVVNKEVERTQLKGKSPLCCAKCRKSKRPSNK